MGRLDEKRIYGPTGIYYFELFFLSCNINQSKKHSNMSLSQAMSLNNLDYSPLTDPSVAIQRQVVIRYPEKSTYSSGEKIVIKLSGTTFLDAKNSAFTFKFLPTGTGLWSFGKDQGSAMNLFNRVRVLAPNGACISDVERSNVFRALANRLKQSKDYIAATGASYGFGLINQASNETYPFTLPLRYLSPFFESDQLLPPQLTDGMTIELYLETPSQAMSTGTSDQQYTIEEPELSLDTSQLADAALRSILASKDMTYEYTDVTQSESFMSAADQQIYFEIPHSLTTAVEAFAVLRTSTSVQNAAQNGFTFRGPLIGVDETDTDEMEWSLGSIKLPQQRAVGGQRIYAALLNSQGVTAGNTHFDIPREFGADKTFTQQIGVYSVDLKRNRMYSNSGRELSNGQRLSVLIKHHEVVNHIVDVFVYFVGRVVLRKGQLVIER